MKWKDGKVTYIALTAQQPCSVSLSFNGLTKQVTLKKGENRIKPSF